MPIDNNQIKAIHEALDKLDKSKIFSGSERNMRILRFLFDCYIKDVHVKESVLEIELFEEKNQSVSYDGKVRVYMFNLRKKLEEYYQTEGADDKIIFHIKKGQYNLSVEQKTKKQEPAKSKKAPLVIVVLSLALIILIFIQLKDSFTPQFCWKPFLRDRTPTTCCVGDHYIILSQFPDGKRLTFYKGDINSDKDFDQFLKTDSIDAGNYTKAPFSFATKMGPVCTSKLAEWFAHHSRSFEVVMESELSLESINDNNIIYIGPFRTMDVFRDLFLKDSKIFSYDGRDIIDLKTKKKIEDFKSNNIREDHVMVSFNKLTDSGHDMIYFAGNNDIGVLAAVKNFCNQKWLKEFYKNIPDDQSYFNALFFVKGIGRTELQCELVKIEVMEE